MKLSKHFIYAKKKQDGVWEVDLTNNVKKVDASSCGEMQSCYFENAETAMVVYKSIMNKLPQAKHLLDSYGLRELPCSLNRLVEIAKLGRS